MANASSRPSSPKAAATAFEPHDHHACAADAMRAAEAACAAKGARLTPVRRRVLELLWESHRAVGAYELLDRLKAENLGSQPPSVYRALDFLIEQGFVHKLSTQNAYLGCAHPQEAHSPLFLICSDCGAVGELRDPSLTEALASAAAQVNFALKDAAIEIEGKCRACAAPASASAP